MQLAQWGFGSFSGVTWQRLRLFAPLTLAGVLVAAAMTKQLNALLLGENYARSMGVAVRRARLLTMFGASMLGAVVTAFCGPIAFLGIAVPHLCRGLLGTSESSRARPRRRADGRRRRARGADRVAPAGQRGHVAAERRDVDHRRTGGRRRSAAQPTRSVRRMTTSTFRARFADAAALRTRDLAVGYRTRRQRRAVLERVNLAVHRGAGVPARPQRHRQVDPDADLARMQPPLWGESSSAAWTALESLSASDLARRLGVVLTERVAVESLPARRIVELGRYPHSGWFGGLTDRDHEVVDGRSTRSVPGTSPIATSPACPTASGSA